MSFTDGNNNQEALTSEPTASVAPGSGPLVGFTVVNASDQTVVEILTDGGALVLDDPDNGSYGIRADVEAQAEIGSVRLQLTGAKDVDKTENLAPYSLYGDSGGNLSGESLPVGEYTLTATAYAERGLGGNVLGTLRVSFGVTGPATEDDQNSPATGQPTISGTAQVGETLTAETSGIEDADGLGNAVFSYQWLADGVDIARATGSSYTPVETDVGKALTVTVTFPDDESNPESLTSPATAPVASAADETEYSCPIVSATLTVGRIGENYGYQSFLNPRAGSLIPATFVLDGVTYTVGSIQTEADYFTVFGVDRELPVGFTLEVDGEQFESSDASLGSYTYGHVYTWPGRGTDWDVGEEVAVSLILRERVENTPQMGGPAICGTAQVGQTLTADTAVVSDDDGLGSGVFEYQWVRRDGTRTLRARRGQPTPRWRLTRARPSSCACPSPTAVATPNRRPAPPRRRSRRVPTLPPRARTRSVARPGWARRSRRNRRALRTPTGWTTWPTATSGWLTTPTSQGLRARPTR